MQEGNPPFEAEDSEAEEEGVEEEINTVGIELVGIEAAVEAEAEAMTRKSRGRRKEDRGGAAVSIFCGDVTRRGGVEVSPLFLCCCCSCWSFDFSVCLLCFLFDTKKKANIWYTGNRFDTNEG